MAEVSEQFPFGHSETITQKSYSYGTDTPPEQVVTDYAAAYETLERVHLRIVEISQGVKYYHDAIGGDPMTYFGSSDDLELALRNYPIAANNLYSQDGASKSYASQNRDRLQTEANEANESYPDL